MAHTHDVGNFFWHTIGLLPNAPRFHRAPTHEIEEPYRVSDSVVIRLVGNRGIVLGHWRQASHDEETALLTALQARETSPLDETGHVRNQYDR